MRKISVACECLAGTLDKPPEEGPIVDVRIQDWLNKDEPRECLHTLGRMESLLQKETSWMPWIFRRGGGSTATQDKIKEAVDVFTSCKGHFHLFFSTELWRVYLSSGCLMHTHNTTQEYREGCSRAKGCTPISKGIRSFQVKVFRPCSYRRSVSLAHSHYEGFLPHSCTVSPFRQIREMDHNTIPWKNPTLLSKVC